MKDFREWYDRNHKKILLVPLILLIFSVAYLGVFYNKTGDIMHKDVSLTGGSTITLFTDESADNISEALKTSLTNFQIKTVSDNEGNQRELIITVPEENAEGLIVALEKYRGYKLTEENSSKETTSASLSKDFYKQLLIAVILAFYWMAAVVFLIFAKGKSIKLKIIFTNLLFGIFLGKIFFSIPLAVSIIILLVFSAYFIRTYIKYSVPAFAVMLSAFADIMMTLVVVNITGMKISTAGIVAFLLLIGYSVDTDILLTTRLIRRKFDINNSILNAFKTGLTMTLTSIAAIATAFFVVYSFSSVLNQIFTILLIGLIFDIFNTWTTNASIMKWYVERINQNNLQRGGNR